MGKNVGKNVSKNLSDKYSSGMLATRQMLQMHLKLLQKE